MMHLQTKTYMAGALHDSICGQNKIRSAKAKYNRHLIEENSDNPSSFWKTMKKVMPGQAKVESTNLVIDGKLCHESQQIAEAFSKHFTDTVSRLIKTAESVYDKGNDFVNCFASGQLRLPNINLVQSSFKFGEVSVQYIQSLLRKLKISKAAGLDDIPPRLLKDAAHVVALPITRIINLSLAQGKVPNDLKIAKVIPVFKKGKRESMDNYRPISILPALLQCLSYWRG